MFEGTADPFSALRELESRFREQAAPLPQEQTQPDVWYGVAFRLGEDLLLGDMGEVQEIMPVPRMTDVPGVKEWVRGLAGSRGELFAVVDLKGFFGEPMEELGARARVLVVRDGEMVSGLLVDEVLGMRRFQAEHWSPEQEGVSEPLAPLLKGIFREADAYYGLLDIPALLRREDFLNARA